MSSPIPITQQALDKANHISARLKELSGTSLECYMWMTTDRDDGVIRDVYILDHQDVTPSHCAINGASKEMSYWRLNTDGHTLLGWCHSHGDFDTFFSGTDKQNYKNEVLRGPENKNGNWAYFLTVNAAGDAPYVARGEYNKTLDRFVLEENVPLEIVEGDAVDMQVDDALLDRVRYNGKTIREHVSGEQYSDAYKKQLELCETARRPKKNGAKRQQLIDRLRARTIDVPVQEHTPAVQSIDIFARYMNYTSLLKACTDVYKNVTSSYAKRLTKVTQLLRGVGAWRWHARLAAIEKLYTKAISASEAAELKQLEKVVKKNRYAMRKYGKKIKRILSRIRKNERGTTK